MLDKQCSGQRRCHFTNTGLHQYHLNTRQFTAVEAVATQFGAANIINLLAQQRHLRLHGADNTNLLHVAVSVITKLLV